MRQYFSYRAFIRYCDSGLIIVLAGLMWNFYLLVYLLCKTSVCSITLIFHPPYWMWTILYRSRACLHPRPSPLAIFNVQVELFLGAKQRILYSFTLYSFVRLSEPTYHPEGLWFSFIPSSVLWMSDYNKVLIGQTTHCLHEKNLTSLRSHSPCPE